MQFKYMYGDYNIIQNNVTFSFGNANSASNFFVSIQEKREFSYNGHLCYIGGTSMDSDGFMLKAYNKGAYHNDNCMYDQYIDEKTIKRCNNNYIISNSQDELSFEHAYNKAVKTKFELEKAFGIIVDVFIYKNQAFTLHHRYIDTVNRYNKSYEFQYVMGNRAYSMKKGVKSGGERAKKLTQAILVSVSNKK